MRKIILLISLALLSALPAFSQNGTIVYNVCRTESDINMSYLMEDTYKVTNVSADSFSFTALNQNYVAKKVPDTDFYFYNTGYRSNDFYIYLVDKKSFFIIPYDSIISIIQKGRYQTWRYYHLDRTLANEKDDNKRCALETLDKAKASIVAYTNQQLEAANKENAARSKVVVTDFVKNYQSKRNDPAINKAILGWWQRTNTDPASIPILQIDYMQPSWVILRNDYGIVTAKSINAIIVYKSKKENACYAGWRSFQYDALGAGTFDTELKDWITHLSTGELDVLNIPDNRQMLTGNWYYVDCAAFPSVPLR